MNTTTVKYSLIVSLTAGLIGFGLVGCGGGKDDPTAVALRPPKGELGGGGGAGDGGSKAKANGGGGAPAQTGGFGKITGRIVVPESDKGSIPSPEVIKYAVGKAPVDSGFCAAQMPIFDDSLEINPMNLGIKNVFFYLEEKPNGGKDGVKEKIESQALWPSAGEGMEGKLVLDQQNCTYKPHAMIVLAGQSFVANSQDAVVHSYKGSPSKSTAFNITIPQNGTKEVTPFTRPERSPVSIICATHNWMQGYQLPLDHPYAAVTDADGGFTISDLPAGEHEFIVWHEKGGKIMEHTVVVNGGEETDIGEITVRLSQLR